MVERLFHWLPGAKLMLWTGAAEGAIAGVAWTGWAAASFTESSLQPQDGRGRGSCGHRQPLLLWESFVVRASPCDAQVSYLSAFDFPLLDLLSQTLSLAVSLLFPFCSCFCSYHSSSFRSISPLFWLPCFSCFSLLLPNHSPHFPLQIIFQGLNHSSSVCMDICMAQSHLLQHGVLGWGTWSSLAPSVVLGDGQEPPEGASAPKGVEGTREVSALLTRSDSNTDKLGVCTCRGAADLLAAPCSDFPPPQSLVSVLQVWHLALCSGPNSDENFQPCSVFALKIRLM